MIFSLEIEQSKKWEKLETFTITIITFINYFSKR